MRNVDGPNDHRTAQVPRLSRGQIRFERTRGGLVRAVLVDGTSHEPVDFYHVFPFSAPDSLISVRLEDGTELGILDNLGELSDSEIVLVRGELNRRYFAPMITAIHSLEERYGQSLWRVETDAGPARFTAQNEHTNLKDLPDGTLLLIDVNGNRYRLRPRSELRTRIRRKLEAMF
jgi:hypothetical protein